MTQLQEQIHEEESSISIESLVAHGISSGDVQILKDAGINTCNRLVKLTNQQVARTGVAKVEKVCEAAKNLVKQQSLTSGTHEVHKIIVLCDEAAVNTILEKQKLDFAIKMFEKKAGGKVQVQLAVTKCTEVSLVNANVILKDSFLTERCGHDPPIGTLECLAKSAKAPKNAIATGSIDMLPQLLFRASTVNVFYAESLNNIQLCPGVTDENDSTSDEEVREEEQKKKKLKRSH